MVATINEKAVKEFAKDHKSFISTRKQTGAKWKKISTSKSVSSL